MDLNLNGRDSTMRGHVMRALLVLTLAAAAAGTASAGSEERKGTNGSHELALPVGGRGVALGGAVVSDASGVEAIFWNPAGLATMERTEAMFSNTQYFADMKLNYAAVGTNLGNFGAIGFNAKVLSIGEVFVTTEDAPEGTGEVLEPTFTVLGLTWARQFTDRVNFGATVNYVNESIQSVSASGVAFDFGVQYVTGWRGLRFGMAMKNFGTSMEYDGANFEYAVQVPGTDPTSSNQTVRSSSSAFEMPSYFNLSAAYDLMSSADMKLTGLAAFQNNNFEGDNVRTGVEWGYKQTFALRGSWYGTFGNTFDATGETEGIEFDSGDDLYSGVALGAGANVRFGETGRLGIDVAWRPVRDYFDDVVDVGLKLAF